MTTPNVLLITIDTVRTDMLGCYGYDTSVTPNIDRLAASGIQFEQAITGGSWTQAAFPTLLTSTYASMYGGCLGPLSPARPSPVETLSAHGYTTAGFSTSPLLSRDYGYDRGFNYFVDLLPEESDPPLRHLKGGERFLRQPLTHYISGVFGKSTRPAQLYKSAAEVTRQVCQWAEEAEAPFFVWAHYMDVHWPYHREETLMHPRAIAQAWRDLAHLHGANWKGLTTTPAQRERYMRLYEEALRYTDFHIGRLLDSLNACGHLANTVVILVSDHGEEFLERSRWGHFETNLYDEILRVPLIIRLPHSQANQVIRRQVRTLDLMPTILDLCGCFPPEGLEGVSLVPLWNQPEIEHDASESISEMWRDEWQIVAVRTEAFKYIWDSRAPDQPRLFDLCVDPGERHDVSEQYPERVRYFRSRLDAHLQRAARTMRDVHRTVPEVDPEVTRRLRDLGYIE